MGGGLLLLVLAGLFFFAVNVIAAQLFAEYQCYVLTGRGFSDPQ